MEIRYSSKAVKDLESVSPEVRRRIAQKMRFYAEQADPLSFAKRLTGHNGLFRFRVGMYRIIFEVMDDCLHVLVIRKRDEAYK